MTATYGSPEWEAARLRRLATYPNLWPWELEQLRAAGITPTGGREVVVDEGLPTERVQRDHADPYEGDPLRKARFNEAVAYIRDYTGRWDFILSLRLPPPMGKWGTKWFRLSDRQVEVILNAKARDAERARERQQNETGRDLTALPYGRTRAAVENESGELTFLLIDRPAANSNWHGWVFVKQQQGPNEVKLGAQRPGQTYVGQWPSLIDKVLADPLAAVARYGLALGICGVCGLPLTNAESRESGIGPVCRSRLGA